MSGLRIKLCGVRRAEDARLCAEAGADEIGVVFAQSSKRRVTLEEAQKIRAVLPAHVALVGVFLDAGVDEIRELALRVPLTAAQLHGRVPSDRALERLHVALYRALHVESLDLLSVQGSLQGFARVLLDGPTGGGSGQCFDWRIVPAVRPLFAQQLFLAGGLTADNVAEAVRLGRPDGVDVASGIEGPDGFKDPARVRAFVAAARAAAEGPPGPDDAAKT